MEKRNSEIKKIALIGPESTGKTTLAEKLADYYKTVWIPEYAREYVANLNREYTLNDIIKISEEQNKQLSNKLKDANEFIFVDTEDIINKIWCEDVFGNCPYEIVKCIEESPFDYYLLLLPDLPWVHDPLRENSERRDYLTTLYRNELLRRNLPFAEISGFGDKRLENARQALENYFIK